MHFRELYFSTQTASDLFLIISHIQPDHLLFTLTVCGCQQRKRSHNVMSQVLLEEIHKNLQHFKARQLELRVTIKWIFHYAVLLLLLFSLSLLCLAAIITLVWVLRTRVKYNIPERGEEGFGFGFGKQFFAVLASFRRFSSSWWSHRLHQISHGMSLCGAQFKLK